MGVIRLLQSMTHQELIETQNSNNTGNISQSEKAIANGVATLGANGKLVQMPTAADVGAIAKNIQNLGNIVYSAKFQNCEVRVATANGVGLLAGLDNCFIRHTACDIGQANAQIIISEGMKLAGTNFSYTTIKSVGSLVINTNSVGTITMTGGSRDIGFVRQFVIAIPMPEFWTF